MYASEKNALRPDITNTEDRVAHRLLTVCARLDSSPALYRRKNPAGRENSRAMVAACTEMDICTLMLLDTMLWITPNSRLLMPVQTINTPTAAKSRGLPLGMTCWYSR